MFSNKQAEEKKEGTRFAFRWLSVALTVIAVVVAVTLFRIYGGST